MPTSHLPPTHPFITNLPNHKEFLDSITILLHSSHPPETIPTRPSFSRKTARTLFAQYDPKELRRGIDTLRARVEKHFGSGDDEAISRALVALVLKECERGYEGVVERAERVCRDVYGGHGGVGGGEGTEEKAVELGFGRGDVQKGFAR